VIILLRHEDFERDVKRTWILCLLILLLRNSLLIYSIPLYLRDWLGQSFFREHLQSGTLISSDRVSSYNGTRLLMTPILLLSQYATHIPAYTITYLYPALPSKSTWGNRDPVNFVYLLIVRKAQKLNPLVAYIWGPTLCGMNLQAECQTISTYAHSISD
jgi:hypothetical protein